MKRRGKTTETMLDEFFARTPQASREQMEAARPRMWKIVSESPALPTERAQVNPIGVRPRVSWLAVSAAAGVLLVGGFISYRVIGEKRSAGRTAIVVVDGALYRVGDQNRVSVGQRVEGGGIVRSNGGGAVVELADRSRVELRPKSEFSVERADDGLKIRLRKGSLIVNAAKQAAGHLYVETKDVVVSVVGTVFLVNAEEEGSRVAVIEGEVRVQQGAAETKLRPGEQVSSSPRMASLPVQEELSWSRNARVHMALLGQAAAQAPPSTPTEPRETFEVASIRPTRFTRGGGERGAGGVGANSLRPAGEPCGDHPNSFFLKLDPGRADISDMTVYGLIAWAYGLECRIFRGSYYIVGGPGWIKSDGFDIQATIPPGSPAYTETPIIGVRGAPPIRQTMTPRFRKMLQSLLEDRFKLVLKRETRQMPVYALSIARGGPKLRTWKEGDPLTIEAWYTQMGLPSEREMALQERELDQLDRAWFVAFKGTMPQLINQLKVATDRPIVDRTGITTTDLMYRFPYSRMLPPYPSDIPVAAVPRASAPSAPSLFGALEGELGLKLDATTAPMEVFVIEQVQKPSEN